MDHQLQPSRRVLLWSSPRSLSTAFERSIRELDSVKVFSEPHLRAYYYGPDRRTGSTHHPNQSELDDSATYEAAAAELLREYDGYEAVFAKELAFYIEGKYDKYIEGGFTHFKHTFLIRHPLKSIPSLVRASERCGLTSPLNDIGIKQLYNFYKVVQQTIEPHPLVIDADDLLEHPKAIMEHYCRETGLEFDEKMLTWQPGEIQDWLSYKYYKEFFGTVMASSGFLKPRSNSVMFEELSKEAQDVYQEVLPFYEAMHRERFQPTSW